MRVRHLEPGARAGWVPRLPRASHRACARRPRKGRQHVKCQLRGKKVSKYGKQLGQGRLTNKGAIDGCDMVTGIGIRQPRTSPAMPLSTVTIIAPLCLGLLEPLLVSESAPSSGCGGGDDGGFDTEGGGGGSGGPLVSESAPPAGGGGGDASLEAPSRASRKAGRV